MSDTSGGSVHLRRHLPARASLEHLRNEAKEKLRLLRIEKPDTRLAEAQFAIARSYGFASWRMLKAYVDELHGSGVRIVQAVRLDDLPTVGSLLRRFPELVNASTDLSQFARPSDTPAMCLLNLAIAEDKVQTLRLLLDRGADPNTRNSHGRLPLHDCFELGRDHLVTILLDAGAEPDVCAAAAYGMHDRLRVILDADPRQANDLTTGESPLGWAVYGRQAESAQILFKYGAVADRPPYEEKVWGPAAMVAADTVIGVLLEHKANPNWRDAVGNTPLHRVLRSRLVVDPEVFVKILLDAGADTSLRNSEDRTALEEALLQRDSHAAAETYSPVQTIGRKRLERTIEMLRASPHATGKRTPPI